MPIYTATADANGDFIVPFSSNYTSGQKVTVTAEKDGATKSIELNAPSDVSGGGVIRFSGNLSNFPNNIGGVVISGITGEIGASSFYTTLSGTWCAKATSLVIESGVTSIGSSAFSGWVSVLSLELPEGLTVIKQQAFYDLTSLLTLTLPSSIGVIEYAAFRNLLACNEITSLALSPPTIRSDTFIGLKSTCIFKVPAASVAAYQAAANWSAYASRIQAI